MSSRATLRLRFLTVQGRIARDPHTRIVIRGGIGDRLIRQVRLQIPPAPAFSVPAIPHVHSNLVAYVAPTNFRDGYLDRFSLTEGAKETKRFVLLRDADKWKPRFERWSNLQRSFASLKRVLNRSPQMRVIGGSSVETFSGSAYDDVMSNDAKLVLAKASLLNLFARLTELEDPLAPGRRWFDYIDRVLKIGRERFVAVIDPVMGRHVKKIRREHDRFEDYERTPAGKHHKNFPKVFDVSKKELFSIKSSHGLGNIQLTVGLGSDPITGRPSWLVDADIDEHGTFWGHLGDLIKHRFTGGTHPYDIHEYLLLRRPTLNLGYRLVLNSGK